jgi:hypothetical protein
MGKKLSAAIASQSYEREFFQVAGLRCEKFAAEVEYDAVQQSSAGLGGDAAIRGSAELTLDSGELLRVEIAESGEWCGRYTHCAGSNRRR